MKTSWGKPVHIIAFIRTLLVVLAVAVCLATLMGCGNSPVEDRIKKLHKAAEQGDAKAQNSLGVKYDLGEGVAEDDAEAFKWYRKAAEQGHASAQCNLGVMYDFGAGVPEDDVAAYAWFSVAAASGDDGGRKNRDSIKRKLTPSQLEKGQAMAFELFERIEKRKAAKAE